jgi:hypothetical protein
VVAAAVAVAASLYFILRGGQTSADEQALVTSGSSAPVCRQDTAKAQLVEEVFYYGVRVRAGRAFSKRWTLQNSGGCTWGTDFRLHHVRTTGEQLSTTIMDIPLRRPVAPGDTAAFVLQMRAPTRPGWYEEIWELRDGSDRAVAVGAKKQVVAAIKVPLPHYPACTPGKGSAILLVRKYPDGTPKQLGEAFRYSWTLKNNGPCAWGAGARLRFTSSATLRMSMADSVVTTRSVEPDETYTFLAPMRMPVRPGSFQEAWELWGAAGAAIPIDGSPSTTMQLRAQAADVPVSSAPICPPGRAVLRFVDENWPDSSRVAPGRELVKRWTVVNEGTCAWPANYRLTHASSDPAQLARSTRAMPLGEIVQPGAAYTFEVPMQAPQKLGFYREDWRFLDDRGDLIMIGTSPYLAALITVEPRHRP